MKILMIATKDYNFYNFRRNFILEMINNGYEVCLVCPYGSKIDFFRERGCNFVDLKIDRRGTNLFNELSLLLQCISIFKEEKPDLVLTYTTKCSVYPGIACRILGIKYIVNNAGLIKAEGMLAFILNVLYKVSFRKASCMMYQNNGERDYLNKLLHNKVHYRDLPGSGVDLHEFDYINYPDESTVVFNYIGRIVELKGIREFLECAKKIKKKYPNAQFRIYGEYDDTEYKSSIEKLEKLGFVKHMGTRLDMREAITEAHAVIHPSYYEGMTNVVLEHSAMGRVCIGSNIPGVADGIDDGVTGYTFEVKNVDSMVEAVTNFLELSYEEKVKMGKAAREKMEREFSREIVTNIYMEEIKRILGEEK